MIVRSYSNQYKTISCNSNCVYWLSGFQLVQEIMRVGSVCENGKITVEYAKLQENTEGMFKSLLGTLISAKKQKVFL